MCSHCLVSGIRSIAGKFACIKDADECIDILIGHLALLERLSNALTRKFRHRNIQFIRNETEQCLVKFLVESCVKILLEECPGKIESLESHLGSLSVLCTCDIRSSGCNMSESRPAGHCECHKQGNQDPEQCRTQQIITLWRKSRSLGADETYVAAKVTDILRYRNSTADCNSFCFIAAFHKYRNSRCLQCHILLLVYIVV